MEDCERKMSDKHSHKCKWDKFRGDDRSRCKKCVKSSDYLLIRLRGLIIFIGIILLFLSLIRSKLICDYTSSCHYHYITTILKTQHIIIIVCVLLISVIANFLIRIRKYRQLCTI